MKIKLIFLFIFMSAFMLIYATPQATDLIIYKEEKFDLLQFPLEKYFFKYQKKRPDVAMYTSSWRGYRALFEIKQNKFYLMNINNLFFDGENLIYKIFNKKNEVFLNWWNGIIVIPNGELMETYKFESIYERLQFYENYIFVIIKNGNVIKELKLNNYQYNKYNSIIMDLYYNTDLYIELVADLAERRFDEIYIDLNDGVLPNEIVEYIKTNFKHNTDFFKYLPLIFYNDNTLTPIIQKYLDENITNYKYIKIIIAGILIVVLILLIIILRRHGRKP